MNARKFAGLFLIIMGAIALLLAFAFNINFAERPYILDP